jgi:hypothetical protein
MYTFQSFAHVFFCFLWTKPKEISQGIRHSLQSLTEGLEIDWLLNYRGGSFLIPNAAAPLIANVS